MLGPKKAEDVPLLLPWSAMAVLQALILSRALGDQRTSLI